MLLAFAAISNDRDIKLRASGSELVVCGSKEGIYTTLELYPLTTNTGLSHSPSSSPALPFALTLVLLFP